MELITIRTDEGVRTAIVVKTGVTKVHLIWADDRKPGVRINKLPKEAMRYAEPLLLNGEPYPFSRAKTHFRRMGLNLGITKSAAQALKIRYKKSELS
jgi:hypothetical protein